MIRTLSLVFADRARDPVALDAAAALAKSEPRASGILSRFAREKGCDLLVMGAFGHSRLREVLLGGATRDLLSEVPLPLLLAR